jgi:hypothetical protein
VEQQWLENIWLLFILKTGVKSVMARIYNRVSISYNSLISNPCLGQGADEIRSSGSKLIVNAPGTGKLTLTTGRGSIQREQRYNITGVRMKDLLVRRISRGSYETLVDHQAEVFNMV